ncbi:Uncharacterised protein [Candidatus Anstonella stagnisolia]|nr:Uncharacterised protein [Candidatus Anstonella stagnisolia]
MMRAIFAILLLMPLLLAQPATAKFEEMVKIPNWFPIFILTMLAMLAIATIVYMVGIALGMMNLKMWAKSEIVNVFAMFLLVLALIGALSATWEISKKITESAYVYSGGAGPAGPIDHFTLARAYLVESLKCERTVYKISFLINSVYETVEKYSMDVSGPEGHSGSVYGAFTGIWHYVTGNLTYLMIFNYVQLRFLDFVEVVMMSLFLPIGIILRTFAPTRGAGGLMIAIAIGFYFVFPMSYVFIYASAPKNSICTQLDQSLPSVLEEDACYTNISDIYVQRARIKAEESGIGAVDDKVKTAVANMLGFGIPDLSGATASGFLLHAIFYPLVCLIITFTFIRQTSALLGADLAEIGRGFIKLI